MRRILGSEVFSPILVAVGALILLPTTVLRILAFLVLRAAVHSLQTARGGALRRLLLLEI